VPDQIAVMDDRAVEDMVKEGFNREHLIITGQPAYDELFQPCDITATRQRVRAALGIGDKDMLLIFASQPFTEMTAESGIPPVAYDEMECLGLLLQSLPSAPDHKIWVRPHPRETAAKFHDLANPQLIVSSEFDRISAIHAADGVTGMSSNFLLEAALLGKPVLSLQPRQQGPGPLPLVSLGLGAVITNTADISAAVRQWLSECHQPNHSHSPASDSPFRPGAAKRVGDVVIDRMQQSKANQNHT
jgi:UDP-N-acetylglucosamine 2-epimerase